MLFIVVLLSALALLDAAPSNLGRVKRSNYGPAYAAAPSYAPSQCGASYYHMAEAPNAPGAPYGYQHALPAPYPSYMPHYRSDNFDFDFSSSQDIDHMAQMRAYGAYDAAAAGPAPGPYGQAVGLFPGANIGGCNVPLLVSCSPSITQGHMLRSSGHYGAADAAPAVAHHLPAQTLPAYRGADATTEVDNEHKQELKKAKQSQDRLDAAADDPKEKNDDQTITS